MRAALLAVARLLRFDGGQKPNGLPLLQSSLVEVGSNLGYVSTNGTAASANVSNVSANASNDTQFRVQPDISAGDEVETAEEECNTNLLLTLEANWVSICYGWDSQDPNIASELRKWVNYEESSVTAHGSAQICVEGAPCIDSVHAYYKSYVEEGCAERRGQEASYKLAHSLETAADACVVVGPAAALDYHPPAVLSNGPLTLEGCYHEYPECSPSCLNLPARPQLPGAQRIGELYFAHGTCYKALSTCQGCLFKPEANENDLQPWNCPDVKCHDDRFNRDDAPLTDPANCQKTCLGHVPCGPDGCGGQCGVCADNEHCEEGGCIWRTFEERFIPKDTRTMPDWYKEHRREEMKDEYTEKREEKVVERLLPDFHRSTLAAKLGIAR